jgi:2-polyprenyl-6-methoxyphenol hydroxylase-like FAD-dependent oxidoreductase
MDMTNTTDVVIIGAGPTGLSLACQLVRYGVNFVIVEKNERITPFSKALGVQARTLEIYEQLGLAGRAVELGTLAKRARLLEGGHVRAEVPLSDIGKNLSPFPFLLLLEQSKNEQLLHEYLRDHGGDVWWNTEFDSLSQDETGIAARISTAGGDSRTINARYLVGCDGPKSSVRRGLELSFEGSTMERLYYVADAQIDWELPHDAVQVCLARDVFTAFFPMKGERRYRIVGTFPEDSTKEEGEVLYEEIEQQIKKEARLALEISNVTWFSTYKVHARRVNKFSEGRGFVAGDAAHIHSPAGAQGMNTGIQDAYNLAWKLALVIKGYAEDNLLDTYNEERLPNAKRLLETTDRIFELGAGSNWLLGVLRTTVLPPLAETLVSFDAVKKLIFPLISQIGINYRHSSLSDHTGDSDFRIKAGDRMPWFTSEGKSIYDRLHQPRFHFLKFSDEQGGAVLPEGSIEPMQKNLIDYHVVPLDSTVREIFGTDRSFSALLRPDNYICSIQTEGGPETIKCFINRVLTASRTK